MTFTELDSLIAGSGRRSIASSLIAHILDALDDGQEGLDLDTFQNSTHFVRNNVTAVANYLQSHGVIGVLYYRDDNGVRHYANENNYGRWAKQHYRPSPSLLRLYRRE
ncbi:hypothetical protein GJV07_23320 [Enterobacteriaceae bacterium RIT711]|nr:hypothetical protein [Enterobacteriaceae bacterium RIT711]